MDLDLVDGKRAMTDDSVAAFGVSFDIIIFIAFVRQEGMVISICWINEMQDKAICKSHFALLFTLLRNEIQCFWCKWRYSAVKQVKKK